MPFNTLAGTQMVNHSPLPVRRLSCRLYCDARRTIARFFWPGKERANRIIERVLAMDSTQVRCALETIERTFGGEHHDLNAILNEHSSEALARTQRSAQALPVDFKTLIGAYFTMEYAFESAALFNPSMVPIMNQADAADDSLHFVMSLRAVGEGHISSIVFRKGCINPDGSITINPPRLKVKQATRAKDHRFQKTLFKNKMVQIGSFHEQCSVILDQLPDHFTADQLEAVIEKTVSGLDRSGLFETALESMHWLAGSEYEIRVRNPDEIEELVLFPTGQAESQGMEDMRAVLFTEEDGSKKYYCTYTAYNGRTILSQLVEIPRQGVAQISTLHGRYAQNKGLPVFPRKVNGSYAMIGRIDGENMFLMISDSVYFCNQAVMIRQPRYAWESVQIGNCGSPIETPAGWLLLTHGVGPMRRYCIGAILLDLKDPSKVIGELEQPLLEPQEDERAGYVPNVVYSCGGLVHNGTLFIPYGISDAATGFASVELDQLLARLA